MSKSTFCQLYFQIFFLKEMKLFRKIVEFLNEAASYCFINFLVNYCLTFLEFFI